MSILTIKGSDFMKFLKKTGIYMALLIAVILLSTIGYISESRKIADVLPRKTTYVPEKEKLNTFVSDLTQYAPANSSKPPISDSPPSPSPVPVCPCVVYTPPVQGDISVRFSENEMIYSDTMGDFRTHNGVDFICNAKEKIKSAAIGTVVDIAEDPFLGLSVYISHSDGIITKYCSLSSAFVSVGDAVSQDTIIGEAGTSAKTELNDGVHLHFEAEKNGKTIDPLTLFQN